MQRRADRVDAGAAVDGPTPPATGARPPRAGATRRERRILAATAALAIGVPAGAAAWVRGATDALAARLTEIAGPVVGGPGVRIGGIDVDLTGAIRLRDIALGDLVAADAVEASVAMGALLEGRLRVELVRIDGPRVRIRVEPDGGSDLARLARWLADREALGPQRSGASGVAGGYGGGYALGLPRVRVARGALTIQVAGAGELSAEGVELVPAAGGARVLTGPVRLRGAWHGAGGRMEVDVAFARSAAELSLPDARLGRVLAVGGTGTAASGGRAPPLALQGVALGRLSAGAPIELRAAVVDGPATRPLAIDVAGDAGGALAITVRGERIPLRALAALAPAGMSTGDARASGTLAIRPRPGGLALTTDATIDGLVVDHPAFAAEPAPLAGRVRGDATISRDAIAWTRGELALGAARISTSGWLRRGPAGAPLAGRIDLRLAPAPCADLFASLPAELRGPLDGMGLRGTLGARGSLAIDLSAPLGEGAALAGSLQGGCAVTAEPPAADVSALAAPGEQQLLDGSRRKVGRGEPDHVALRALPAYVPAAFVAVEDARFFAHGGFDAAQIARSLEIDLRERRLVRGASTISQQLVKNAFLSPRRSVDRKLHEAVLAWRLEARLGKRQILERYLNVIELGPRVFGLAPAARHWFGVPARELTVRQAAFLAALTAQPAHLSRRVRRAGGLDPESAERVELVLHAMRASGALSARAYERARTAPLRFAPSALRE